MLMESMVQMSDVVVWRTGDGLSWIRSWLTGVCWGGRSDRSTLIDHQKYKHNQIVIYARTAQLHHPSQVSASVRLGAHWHSYAALHRRVFLQLDHTDLTSSPVPRDGKNMRASVIQYNPKVTLIAMNKLAWKAIKWWTNFAHAMEKEVNKNSQ